MLFLSLWRLILTACAKKSHHLRHYAAVIASCSNYYLVVHLVLVAGHFFRFYGHNDAMNSGLCGEAFFGEFFGNPLFVGEGGGQVAD